MYNVVLRTRTTTRFINYSVDHKSIILLLTRASVASILLPTGNSPMASNEASSHDPFELNRLAEELSVREKDTTNPHGERRSDSVDLPQLQALTHDNEYLTSPEFNVEEFLLSRSNTSLQDLRTELREYLAILKEELVRLINDDYEAFISLSTDLQGEGERLERIKWPLGELRSRIKVRYSVYDALLGLKPC